MIPFQAYQEHIAPHTPLRRSLSKLGERGAVARAALDAVTGDKRVTVREQYPQIGENPKLIEQQTLRRTRAISANKSMQHRTYPQLTFLLLDFKQVLPCHTQQPLQDKFEERF